MLIYQKSMFDRYYCCMHIEDLTLVVISYEIYETSLEREMNTSVRFYLSYDRFKLDFIAFKARVT